MLLAQHLSLGTSNFWYLLNFETRFLFFFFSSISMIKSFSVVLCWSGSLFLSLSVWIVNYEEGKFSPSVLSSVARAPCWDNVANAQNSPSFAKRTGMHTVEAFCRYIGVMYRHSVCRHPLPMHTHTQPYVHQLRVCTSQSKQRNAFTGWISILVCADGERRAQYTHTHGVAVVLSVDVSLCGQGNVSLKFNPQEAKNLLQQWHTNVKGRTDSIFLSFTLAGRENSSECSVASFLHITFCFLCTQDHVWRRG